MELARPRITHDTIVPQISTFHVEIPHLADDRPSFRRVDSRCIAVGKAIVEKL